VAILRQDGSLDDTTPSEPASEPPEPAQHELPADVALLVGRDGVLDARWSDPRRLSRSFARCAGRICRRIGWKAINLVNLASALVDAGGSIALGAAEAAGAVAAARQIVDELDDELERDEARQLFRPGSS
jgi:hypothetical protein